MGAVTQVCEPPIVVVQAPPPTNTIPCTIIVGAASVVERISPPIVTKWPVTVEAEIGPGLITVGLVNEERCAITDVLLCVVGLVTRDPIEVEEVIRWLLPEVSDAGAELDYYEPCSKSQ